MSTSAHADSLITRAASAVAPSARSGARAARGSGAGGLKIFAFLQGDDMLAFRPCAPGPQILRLRVLTGAPIALQAQAEFSDANAKVLARTSLIVRAQAEEARPEEAFFAERSQRAPYVAVGEFDVPEGCALVVMRLTPAKQRVPVLALDSATLTAKETAAAAGPARMLLRASSDAPARVAVFPKTPLEAGRGYGVLMSPPLIGTGSGSAALRRYAADGSEIAPESFETIDAFGASTFSLPCLSGDALDGPYPKAFGLSAAPQALEIAVTPNMPDVVAALDATQLELRQTDTLEEIGWLSDDSAAPEERLNPRHAANRGVGAMDVLYQRVLDVAQDLRAPHGAAELAAASAAARDSGGARTAVSGSWPGADYFRASKERGSEAEICSVAGLGKCLKFQVSQFFSPWQMRNSFGKEVSATFIVNGAWSAPVKWVNDKSTVLLPLNTIDSEIKPGDVIDFFSPGTGKILFTFTFPDEADEVVDVADFYFQYLTRGALFFRARRTDNQRRPFTAQMALSVNGKERTEAVEFSRIRDEELLLQARVSLPKAGDGGRAIRLGGARLLGADMPARRAPDLACLGTECVLAVGDVARTPEGGLALTAVLYRERGLIDYSAILVANAVETPLELEQDRPAYRFAGTGRHRLTVAPEALKDSEATIQIQQLGGSGAVTVSLALASEIAD